ncbi:MAG: FKBP-type peptidyl-prolyl cis-trans isomerase [Bacteroidales bacterium]|nr:FKBP-type peptidyl-prolyl cis-trans isomerase [Bacteroidales bacterium]
MKHLLYLSFLSFLAFSACSGEKKYEKLPSGLEYKFIVKNESSLKSKPGDVWNLNIKYYNSSDSLLFNSKEVAQDFVMYAPKDSMQGSIEEGIYLMGKGDSAVFLADAETFYVKSRKMNVPKFIKPGEKLLFQIKLNDIIDGAEYQKSIDQWVEKMNAQELLVIRDFIEKLGYEMQIIEPGVYKKVLKAGNLAQNEDVKNVTVNYIGSFVDGREFDNTYKRGETFKFPLGENKTVKGFEAAVKSMKKGEKSLFIIPSKFGYGPYGRKGVIKGFAPLIFEVELIDFE